MSNPYIDEWSTHYGHCNACGEDAPGARTAPDDDPGTD